MIPYRLHLQSSFKTSSLSSARWKAAPHPTTTLMVHQTTQTYLWRTKAATATTSPTTRDLAAYDKFLDRWKFRSAFPTAEHPFNALGKKHTWQNYLENAPHLRLTDFAVISGWRPPHRELILHRRRPCTKSDPIPSAASPTTNPPSSQTTHRHVARGESATFDSTSSTTRQESTTGNLNSPLSHPASPLFAEFFHSQHVTDQFSYLHQSLPNRPSPGRPSTASFSLSSAPLPPNQRDLGHWDTSDHAANTNEDGRPRKRPSHPYYANSLKA